MLRRTILLTFLKRFDPRIDLAQFFGPPGVGLSYHQGHSCGPPWQPLAPSRLWTGLPSVSDLPLRIGIFGPFLHTRYSLVPIIRPVQITNPMGILTKIKLTTRPNCRPDGDSSQN